MNVNYYDLPKEQQRMVAEHALKYIKQKEKQMNKEKMIKELRRLEGENKNLGTEIKILLDILVDKDLTEIFPGCVAQGIKLVDDKFRFYFCTGGSCSKDKNYCDYSLHRAEEIHRKLGQMIAYYKRTKGETK